MEDLSSDEDESFYTQEEENRMILTVQDSGVGISQDD